MTHHQLTERIAIDLPRDWTVTNSLDPATQATIDTLMRHSRDSLLQASLRNGMPQTLLSARSPSRALSLNLNVSPSPGATLSTFGQFAAGDYAAHAQALCRVLGETFGRANIVLDSCGPAVADTAGGRAIVLLEYRRHGDTGAFIVWLAQYALPDAIVSLTLVAPQADAAMARPFLSSIWRSVRLR
jgi:hypothetical protein